MININNSIITWWSIYNNELLIILLEILMQSLDVFFVIFINIIGLIFLALLKRLRVELKSFVEVCFR
jgi:hypothetical protein